MKKLKIEDEAQANRHTRRAVDDMGRTPTGEGSTEENKSRDRTQVRLAVNLGPETADALKEYANRKGVSVTEAVRRAIAVLTYVDEAQRRGASLNVEEGGVLKEVVFLA